MGCCFVFFCHDKVQASDGGCLIPYDILVIEEESDRSVSTGLLCVFEKLTCEDVEPDF